MAIGNLQKMVLKIAGSMHISIARNKPSYTLR